jgi:hypothetical protein
MSSLPWILQNGHIIVFVLAVQRRSLGPPVAEHRPGMRVITLWHPQDEGVTKRSLLDLLGEMPQREEAPNKIWPSVCRYEQVVWQWHAQTAGKFVTSTPK